ncbi:MAG: porin, partial [Syntrophales bacterium]|nr:porin [Syntrophales bacterium]
MKKFWIVLLALGLVAAFAMSASAADVKFSGQYYVQGIYIDNPYFQKDKTVAVQAFYHQRLRIQTEFKVAEGLSLVTRFDALETPWGDTNWSGTGNSNVNRPAWATAKEAGNSNSRVQENIEFERAYIDFTTKIGKFMVGYQNFVAWGTMFLDTHVTFPGIKYIVPIGPVTMVAAVEKRYEYNDGPGLQSDHDNDVYDLGAIYKFGAGDAGLMYQFANNRRTRSTGAASYTTQIHVLNPYVKAKFGSVYVEAEGVYGLGKMANYENAGAGTDVEASAWGAYVHAKADVGPGYVGGMFAYLSGDDPNTADKREGTMAYA